MLKSESTLGKILALHTANPVLILGTIYALQTSPNRSDPEQRAKKNPCTLYVCPPYKRKLSNIRIQKLSEYIDIINSFSSTF